jgi:hypothetical protein
VTTPSKSTDRILRASAIVRSRAVCAPVLTIRYGSANLLRAFYTYYNIDSLVDVDDSAGRVNNRHRTNTPLGEHVNDIKDGSVERSGSERVELVSIRILMIGIDVGSNSPILDASSEILGDISTLSISFTF